MDNIKEPLESPNPELYIDKLVLYVLPLEYGPGSIEKSILYVIVQKIIKTTQFSLKKLEN